MMFRWFQHTHRVRPTPTLQDKAADYAALIRTGGDQNSAIMERLEKTKPKLHLVARSDGIYYPMVYAELHGPDLRTVHFGPWPTVEAAYRAIRQGPLRRHA